jgi:hypothetical protein
MDWRQHSTEDLQSPTCPNCRVMMRWCRSELVKFVPVTSLHLFNCPTCSLLAESETAQEPIWVAAHDVTGSHFRFFGLAA